MITNNTNLTAKKGASLVEILIASSVITLTLVVLISVYSMVAKFALSNVRVLKATVLVEEVTEVLGYMRDAGFNSNIASLVDDTTYRVYWDGTVWTIITAPVLLEERYDVSFALSPVYRDTNFNVISSGGTLDNNSRKVVITVAWREGVATSTKSAETYLFNVFNN